MKLFDPPQLKGQYLSKVLASKWLTTGPRCQELQEKLAEFLGCRTECVVLGSSATACWQAILDLYLPRRVNITKSTWVGMHHAIEKSDCRSETVISVRTDIGGRRCDDPDWAAGVIRVADRCHSWVLDETADFSIFSLYPCKLVFGAEGGVVVCRSAEDAARLRLHLYCGLVPGAAGNGRPSALCGRKSNMTDIAAALNLEALVLSPAYMTAIGDAWAQLADCAYARDVPFRAQPVRPYLAQVEMPADRIPDTMSALKARGIPSAWNFNPAGLLTLPCYPGMTLTDADRVIDAVSKEVPSPRRPLPPQ